MERNINTKTLDKTDLLPEYEKINRMYKNFSCLSKEKQDYILGILQALVFAHEEHEKEKETAKH